MSLVNDSGAGTCLQLTSFTYYFMAAAAQAVAERVPKIQAISHHGCEIHSSTPTRSAAADAERADAYANYLAADACRRRDVAHAQ